MAWLNSNWAYRKKITIAGSAGASANYQVLLNIGDAAGGSFNLGGLSANFPAAVDDGGDFRFTADDGSTELGFWVKSVAGGVATVYVKVTADLTSNRDIYIYYGYAAASNASSGNNTFLIYDDFSGSSVDTTKWTVTGGSPVVSGGNLQLGVSGAISSEGLKTGGGAMMAEYSIDQHITVASDVSFQFADITDDDVIRLGYTTYFSSGVYSYGSNTYSLGQTGHGDLSTNIRDYLLAIYGTTLSYNNGSVSGTRTMPNSVNSQTFYFVLSSGGASFPGRNISYLRVRKYTTNGTEPSFSAASAVEDVDVDTLVVTSIARITATGNGDLTGSSAATVTERGFCWDTVTAPTTADPKVTVAGTSGVYSGSITGLIGGTLYYVRAYAITSLGTFYGNELTFTALPGFTNPGNVYTSNNAYATCAATSGVLGVRVSKDAGATWSTIKTKTFTSSDSTLTYGTGITELWGLTWTRADMVDANFRLEISHGLYTQVYKTFGFATGSESLTGVRVRIEAKYTASTMSVDLIDVTIYYGNSALAIDEGAQAFASDGRKNGEGAGAGTGVLVYHDGSTWIATDTGTAVAA